MHNLDLSMRGHHTSLNWGTFNKITDLMLRKHQSHERQRKPEELIIPDERRPK